MKILTEFLLFPLYVVFVLMFMLLVILALPLKISALNKMVMRFLE